jgi:hypothetical protein
MIPHAAIPRGDAKPAAAPRSRLAELEQETQRLRAALEDASVELDFARRATRLLLLPVARSEPR